MSEKTDALGPGRRQWALWAGGLAVTVVIIAAVAFGWRDVFPTSRETPAPAKTEGPTAGASLAVLPFENLNARGDDGFADGLSIDIASVFARTGAFRMPSMTSTFRFKGNLDDTRAIGRALNVDYLIEGNILKSGDDLRIGVNLVRAEDDFLIWSQTFSEKLGSVFVAQERIAKAIGTALSTPLDIDADILKAQRTEDPRAYELYVRGLALLERRGLALKNAMAVLELAVVDNPDFAAAWGALSLAYDSIPAYIDEIDGRPVNPVVYYRKAKRAALEGQKIDPDLPSVRNAMGTMLQRDRQWIAAEDTYRTALRNNPNAHSVMADYAVLLHTVGKRIRALDLIEQARQIDPLNARYEFYYALLRWEHDRTETNIAAFEDMFRRLPQYRKFALRVILDHRAQSDELDKARGLIEACRACPAALRTLALGMLDAAPAEPAEQLFDQYKNDIILGYPFLYAFGGADIALDAFRYYGLEAKRRIILFTVPWELKDVLGQRPQFFDIANDIGLVEYWQARGFPDGCTLTDNDRLVCDIKNEAQ